MMTQPLNDRLREERKRKGLTQEQLAGLMSVSRQTISHWETGRASPDYESLRHLSEALEINLSDLLGEEKEQQAADVAIPSAAQEEGEGEGWLTQSASAWRSGAERPQPCSANDYY